MLTSKVLPLVESTIEHHFEKLNFNLKAKVGVVKLKEMLSEINSAILAKLFGYTSIDSDSEEAEASDSDDYADRVKEKRMRKWKN